MPFLSLGKDWAASMEVPNYTVFLEHYCHVEYLAEVFIIYFLCAPWVLKNRLLQRGMKGQGVCRPKELQVAGITSCTSTRQWPTGQAAPLQTRGSCDAWWTDQEGTPLRVLSDRYRNRAEKQKITLLTPQSCQGLHSGTTYSFGLLAAIV